MLECGVQTGSRHLTNTGFVCCNMRFGASRSCEEHDGHSHAGFPCTLGIDPSPRTKSCRLSELEGHDCSTFPEIVEQAEVEVVPLLFEQTQVHSPIQLATRKMSLM